MWRLPWSIQNHRQVVWRRSMRPGRRSMNLYKQARVRREGQVIDKLPHYHSRSWTSHEMDDNWLIVYTTAWCSLTWVFKGLCVDLNLVYANIQNVFLLVYLFLWFVFLNIYCLIHEANECGLYGCFKHQ